MSIKGKVVSKGSSLANIAIENSPKLLTAGLIFGVSVTAVVTAVSTWKAIRAIDEEEEDRWKQADIRARKEEKILKKDYDTVFDENYIPLTTMDKVRIGAPYYIPPFILAALTITDGVCLYKDMDKRMGTEVARLTAEMAAKEASHKLYKEEVVKKIGEKKERDIEYNAHEREINEKVMPRVNDDMATRCGAENGEQLIYDPHTGQEWVSTIEEARRAIQMCIDDLRVNEFYDYQLLLSNMGAKDANLTYRWAVQSAGMDHDAIDKDTCLELHFGKHNGHEVSVAWLNIPIVDIDKV